MTTASLYFLIQCEFKKMHFEMQLNKQILTKLNVILCVSFKILQWIFPLLLCGNGLNINKFINKIPSKLTLEIFI